MRLSPLPTLLLASSLLASSVFALPQDGAKVVEKKAEEIQEAVVVIPRDSPQVEALPEASKIAEKKDEPKQQVKKDEKPKPPKEEKYFNEPGTNDETGHYDARYFKGLVEYEQHRPALRLLIRSYLTIFRKLEVETWLAHGTLLGWWWNGRIMPWDYDLDVQVSHQTLFYLAEHHNRTMHEYKYVDEKTGEEATKTYLLDINPSHKYLSRLQGMNIIDARWIDTSNGMFVDITGLAEREPEKEPGIWSCKNHHKYRTRDLYPMRETEYEGVPAMVPYNFDRILTEEYGVQSLVTTEWLGSERMGQGRA
ncbi:LicD family-domain-containing protein [Bombardia bombarda]|uniref:LicD family-domain-containing protein n=1 Tax=Bombardia bombarda TaxID=252184 RepID=A0AA40CEK2_9PEZI|nr:LicD family-domain-containing protein [Bombardia bombarda]